MVICVLAEILKYNNICKKKFRMKCVEILFKTSKQDNNSLK